MSTKQNSLVFFNNLKWKQNEYIPQHFHACYEIVYYLNAIGETNVGNKNFKFVTNNFCIIPVGIQHDEHHFIEGNTIFLGIDTDKLNMEESSLFKDDSQLSIKKIIMEIMEEISSQHENYQEVISALIDLLIIKINRLNNASFSNKTKDVTFIKTYIDENYHFKIDFTQLALLINYSEGHLRKLFKDKYKISPRDYLINVRLEKAKNLLMSSNENCQSIVEICGFSDAAQFSKMFKRKYNCSPKNYAMSAKQK